MKLLGRKKKPTPKEIAPPDLSNIVSLEEFKHRPQPAGKEPPMGGNYLKDLRVGTEFLVRDVRGNLTPTWLVLEWIFGGLHASGNVLLIPAKTPNDPKTWQWVDPLRFCQAYEFRGIVEEPPEETVDV